MQLLLAILAVLVSGILVVLVPGSCMVAIWRLDRIVPPPLIPATALALGLVPLTAAMSAALLLHLPIAWVAGALALFVALGWARVVGREARERRRASTVRSGPRAGAREWIAPLRSLVGGEWLRATPRSVLLVAAAGGVLALYVGFYAWNDSLYHIGQAQKLLALDHPTFSNTLQFPDGSAHPGYLLPAWQEVIALVSFVSQQDPVTAAWILPALTFPVSVTDSALKSTRARSAKTSIPLSPVIFTPGPWKMTPVSWSNSILPPPKLSSLSSFGIIASSSARGSPKGISGGGTGVIMSTSGTSAGSGRASAS